MPAGEVLDGLLTYFDKLDAYSQYLCERVNAERNERQHQVLDEGEQHHTMMPFTQNPHLRLLEQDALNTDQIGTLFHKNNFI